MDSNLTDELVERIGKFIVKYPIQTRDYTFGEVGQILATWESSPDNRDDIEFAKIDVNKANDLFGKYGKGSLTDSKERHTARAN